MISLSNQTSTSEFVQPHKTSEFLEPNPLTQNEPIYGIVSLNQNEPISNNQPLIVEAELLNDSNIQSSSEMNPKPLTETNHEIEICKSTLADISKPQLEQTNFIKETSETSESSNQLNIVNSSTQTNLERNNVEPHLEIVQVHPRNHQRVQNHVILEPNVFYGSLYNLFSRSFF